MLTVTDVCKIHSLQGYCDFLPEEKLLEAVQVGQVVFLYEYVAYLVFSFFKSRMITFVSFKELGFT